MILISVTTCYWLWEDDAYIRYCLTGKCVRLLFLIDNNNNNEKYIEPTPPLETMPQVTAIQSTSYYSTRQPTFTSSVATQEQVLHINISFEMSNSSTLEINYGSLRKAPAILGLNTYYERIK